MTRLGRGLPGAGAGLLAGTAAVATSEAVTALLDGVSSPLLSVANRAVDAAPRPVKEWAISTFGTADKPVLIGGVIGTVALMALLIGVLGVRRPRLAAGAFLLLTAVATVAALFDRSATAGPALRLVPALVLAVVGLVALLTLLRPLRRPVAGAGGGSTDTAHSSDAVETPPASEEPHARIEQREVLDSGKHRLVVGDLLPERVEGDRLPAAFDRRAFLATAAPSALWPQPVVSSPASSVAPTHRPLAPT